MSSTGSLPLTPSVRYPCCAHCPDEKCPRLSGHPLPCGNKGCESENPIGAESEGEDVATEEILQHLGELRLIGMKEDLISNISKLVGYEPPGIRVLLRTMSHPSVIEAAVLYFGAIDENSRCTNYEPPWNCAREAEAQYDNIQQGWLGSMGGIGYNEATWCESCRKRVMGT